jgi:hypothetical protein
VIPEINSRLFVEASASTAGLRFSEIYFGEHYTVSIQSFL